MFFRRNLEPVSWIVVCLGNPGLRYYNTRHNAGFMTADIIANRLAVKIDRIKFNAMTAVVTFGGRRVLLVMPQTYMNLSGKSVRQAMNFYKTPLENVIVVSDEVSLPVGGLRVRRSGSSGGHNGLRDIITKCGGEGFPRVRIGVGAPPHDEYDMADWVLSVLGGDDLRLVSEAALKAAAAVETIIMDGVDSAMSKYN
ncbi:MAG: aminoacyl-tRNA hydrolase [Oscillospiraceae bacterium]|nr:aminoacyl-tRNA hydrolase [Oscillospiraceae bacterium]